jgi:hypothetical protein
MKLPVINGRALIKLTSFTALFSTVLNSGGIPLDNPDRNMKN